MNATMNEEDNTHRNDEDTQNNNIERTNENKTYEVNTTKNILLYRNGDKFFPPKRFVVNKKYIRTWDSFLEELTKSIQPRSGAIRDIRTPFHGTRIRSLDDLTVNGKYVAVPKGEAMKLIDYTSVIDVASHSYQAKQETRRLRPLRPANHDVEKIESRINQQLYTKGIVIFVYRNGDPFTRGIKIVLNQFEQKHMNTLVRAIEDRVLLPSNRPIRRLYTMEGEIIRYAKDVEDGSYYVAAAHESFHNIKYGQFLPVIKGGKVPSGRHKIKYLNQSPTPKKDRQHIERSPNDLMTQRSPKSGYNSDRINDNPARKSKKPINKERDEKEMAAIKIQAAFRGYSIRNEIKRAQENNEPIVQSKYRYEPKKVRPQKNNYTRNTENVQNTQEKKKETKVKVVENKNKSNTITKKPNQKEDRKESNVHDANKEHVAASNIQAGFRGYLARKQMSHLQEPPRQNVVEIHRVADNKDRKVVPKKENEKNENKFEDRIDDNNSNDEERRLHAAIQIQAGLRGYKTREGIRRREEAATTIQAGYKGYRHRKRIQDREKAAVRIQAGYKGYRHRKKMQDRVKAAVTIQAGFRGLQTRKTINSDLNARLQEKTAEEQAHERTNAAAKIQAGFRGHTRRKGAAL